MKRNTNLVLITNDLKYYQIKRKHKASKDKYSVAAIVKAEAPLSKAQVELFRVDPEKLYALNETED